jgi:hypothetical protein
MTRASHYNAVDFVTSVALPVPVLLCVFRSWHPPVAPTSSPPGSQATCMTKQHKPAATSTPARGMTALDQPSASSQLGPRCPRASVCMQQYAAEACTAWWRGTCSMHAAQLRKQKQQMCNPSDKPGLFKGSCGASPGCASSSAPQNRAGKLPCSNMLGEWRCMEPGSAEMQHPQRIMSQLLTMTPQRPRHAAVLSQRRPAWRSPSCLATTHTGSCTSQVHPEPHNVHIAILSAHGAACTVLAHMYHSMATTAQSRSKLFPWQSC